MVLLSKVRMTFVGCVTFRIRAIAFLKISTSKKYLVAGALVVTTLISEAFLEYW